MPIQKKSDNGKPSNTAIIQNMKATYDHLTKKNEYEHKSQLCDLNGKFKELQVMLDNKSAPGMHSCTHARAHIFIYAHADT